MPIGFSTAVWIAVAVAAAIAVSIAFLLHMFHLPVMYTHTHCTHILRSPQWYWLTGMVLLILHMIQILCLFSLSRGLHRHRHRRHCRCVRFFSSYFQFYVLLYSFADTMHSHIKPIQVHLTIGLQMHFFTLIHSLIIQSLSSSLQCTIYKFITHSKLRIYIITQCLWISIFYTRETNACILLQRIYSVKYIVEKCAWRNHAMHDKDNRTHRQNHRYALYIYIWKRNKASNPKQRTLALISFQCSINIKYSSLLCMYWCVYIGSYEWITWWKEVKKKMRNEKEWIRDRE